MVQQVKNPPAMQETQEMWVQSLDQEDPLEKETAFTPVFLLEKSHGQKSLVDSVQRVTKSQVSFDAFSRLKALKRVREFSSPLLMLKFCESKKSS